MRRITSSKEATGKIKSSFELILLTNSDRRPQCSEVSVQTTVPEVKRKERSPSSVVTIKRRRGNKGTTVPFQSQKTVEMNLNHQLPAPLTPGNGSNEERDWEVATMRNIRKQRKKIVAENVTKIRQTKTGDVLVQLQRGSNATNLKGAVTTAIGSKATVLQLSQPLALDVRDMDTTEGEVQKALAETAGIPVEVLKVKAMRPMYGGMQMAIVTTPRMNALYIMDNRDDAAIHVLPRANAQVSSTERGNGYTRCVLDGTAVYSCYYSPSASLEIFQDDLDGNIKQWPGPIIVAGDFNPKSRSWKTQEVSL